MAVARERTGVDLDPGAAFGLWTDLSRWATFVDGFAHVDRLDGDWPHEGTKLRWRSVPAGRGLVTEHVTASEPGVRFVTQVFDERLSGTQSVRFEADEHGCVVGLELEYELTKSGPLAALTDVLFIRRALTDALRRTLRRFGVEAAEEAALDQA